MTRRSYAFFPGGRAGVSTAQAFRSDLPPVDAVAVVEPDLVLTILDSEYASRHLAEVAQWLGFTNQLVLAEEMKNVQKSKKGELTVVKEEEKEK